MTDVLGIASTACIVLAFCFNNLFVVRLINFIGSILFVFYGIRVEATYTTVANAIMIVINLYYMIKYNYNGDLRFKKENR